MTIRQLKLYRLNIPFQIRFKHGSAERHETESVWVEAQGDVLQGIGEGCPREYVTGEDIESVTTFFMKHHDSLCATVHSIEDLVDWSVAHQEDIDRNPAAWCSIELALLDLLAQHEGISVERLLSVNTPEGIFKYSAVIGDSEAAQFRRVAIRYGTMGFAEFKIKLSGQPVRDHEKVAILEGLKIDGLRVRVDANNLWHDADLAADHLRSLDCSFVGIEEPLEAGNFDGMRLVAAKTNCRIILDESLLRSDQLRALAPDANRWIVNVRVSKMGGLLRSLALMESARALNIPVIVGAQVGETSLLTRVGLSVAQAAGPQLLSQEGAFGTMLLEHDVVHPPLMFGPSGNLDSGLWRFAEKPGWGLDVAPWRSMPGPSLNPILSI